MLQRCEDAWAADIAVLAQDFAGCVQLVSGNRALNGLDHIASTGVRDEALGVGRPHFKKLGDRFSSKGGNIAMQLVFEPTPGIDETDFFTVFGFVNGPEVLESELLALVLTFPDGSGGSVTKKTEADEHAGLVIQVKSSGGNFHGYCSYGGLGIRSEETARGFKKRQGRAAAEAEQVLEKGTRADSEDF